MEIQKIKKEYKDWIIKIRLARYVRLSMTLENEEELNEIKQLLLEDGFIEESLNQEVVQYEKLSDEKRFSQLEGRTEELVSLIKDLLNNLEEISSEEYPELYLRIQELIALDPSLGNKLIKEVFKRENINHCISCGNSLYGKPCTYYFSKTLSYK